MSDIEDQLKAVTTKDLIAIAREHNRKGGYWNGDHIEELIYRIETCNDPRLLSGVIDIAATKEAAGLTRGGEIADGEVFKKTNKKAKAEV